MYPYIMALSFALTAAAFWRYNVLIALAAMSSWIGILAYHIANQPSSITQGSSVDSFIIVAYVAMALASLFTIWQNSPKFGFIFGKKSEEPKQVKGIMELSPQEYKAYMRAKTRGRSKR